MEANDDMESLTDSERQRINHEEANVQLKRIILRCKTLLEQSEDTRLNREKNLLLDDGFRVSLCTPNDVWTSSLDTLKENPLIWAAYIRGKNDYNSSHFKTLLAQQTATFDPALANLKMANFPAKINLKGMKNIISDPKMTKEKFMDDFYQFLLSKSKDGKKKKFHKQ